MKQMYHIKRIVGDSVSTQIADEIDLEMAMCIADENCQDEMPTAEEQEEEDFSWEDYEGIATVTDDDNDCIIYWVNGEGKTGTDLPESDARYTIVIKHME